MINQDRPDDRQQQVMSSHPDAARRSADSSANEAGNGTIKQKMKEDVQDAKHEAGVQVREKAAAGQQRLADEAGALSDAIDAAAAHLDEQDRDGLARYAHEMSSKLAAAARQLEGRSVDQLAEDAKRLARDNPALFLLGSVAVGFGLSRFFKASDKHDRHESHASHDAYKSAEPTHWNDEAIADPLGRRSDHGMAEAYLTPGMSRSGNGRDTV